MIVIEALCQVPAFLSKNGHCTGVLIVNEILDSRVITPPLSKIPENRAFHPFARSFVICSEDFFMSETLGDRLEINDFSLYRINKRPETVLAFRR
jgi:hypothetical protein